MERPLASHRLRAPSAIWPGDCCLDRSSTQRACASTQGSSTADARPGLLLCDEHNFILGDFFVAEASSPCRFDTTRTPKEDYDYTCTHMNGASMTLTRCPWRSRRHHTFISSQAVCMNMSIDGEDHIRSLHIGKYCASPKADLIGRTCTDHQSRLMGLCAANKWQQKIQDAVEQHRSRAATGKRGASAPGGASARTLPEASPLQDAFAAGASSASSTGAVFSRLGGAGDVVIDVEDEEDASEDEREAAAGEVDLEVFASLVLTEFPSALQETELFIRVLKNSVWPATRRNGLRRTSSSKERAVSHETKLSHASLPMADQGTAPRPRPFSLTTRRH